MSTALPRTRIAAFTLFALTLIIVARFNLGPFTLSGLVSYMLMDLAEITLRRLKIRALVSRTIALVVFTVLSIFFAWVLMKFFKLGLLRLPVLLDTVLPRLAGLFERYGIEFPAENARELRDLMVASLRTNVASIGATSSFLTRTVFQVIAGMFAAALRFLSPWTVSQPNTLADALTQDYGERLALFMRSFERVVGAQVLISTINTALTAAFLVSMDFPFSTFLILATFVCGMIPIVGNIISNTIIVAAGLTGSVHLAMFGLVYLVIIHKLEYLLNSRIVGNSINSPMWLTLIGLIAGEALMGVPGVLLAPALIDYVRAELRAIKVPASL